MTQPQEHRREPWLKWSLGLLVLLNLALLTTVWLTRLKPQPRPDKPGIGGREREIVQQFMEAKLGLSPDQRGTMARLRDEHFARTDALRRQINLLRRRIVEEVIAAAPDRNKVAKLAAELGERQAATEMLTYDHFAALFALCQPGQKENFRAMVADLLDRLKPQKQSRPAAGEGSDRPAGEGRAAADGSETPPTDGERPGAAPQPEEGAPGGDAPPPGRPGDERGELARVQNQVARLRERLKLDEGQVEALTPILERFARRIDESRGQAGGATAGTRRDEKVIKDQRDEAIASLLTDAQKALFAEMKKERRGPNSPPPDPRR